MAGLWLALVGGTAITALGCLTRVAFRGCASFGGKPVVRLTFDIIGSESDTLTARVGLHSFRARLLLDSGAFRKQG